MKSDGIVPPPVGGDRRTVTGGVTVVVDGTRLTFACAEAERQGTTVDRLLAKIVRVGLDLLAEERYG